MYTTLLFGAVATAEAIGAATLLLLLLFLLLVPITGPLLSAVGSSAVQNVQNSMTYILNSSAETVAEQLRSIRAHAAVEQLRG